MIYPIKIPMLSPKHMARSLYSMETQGLSIGSIRNSHREIHAVKRKFAPALFQQLASKLVESCSEDLVLRQRLDPERARIPLQKGGFYVMENEGKAEPGFIVFLPGKPPIFLQSQRGKDRRWRANTLRMRVSASVSEGGGSILIATLDDVLHRLRLEDVWMWRGVNVRDEGFAGRREYLKEFVNHHWVPDARLLGGIFTSIAQPISLEAFAAKKDWSMVHSVEFIPEMAGRRRMVLFLEAQVKAAEGHAGLKQGRERNTVPMAAPMAAPIAAPMAVTANSGVQRRVKAVAVDSLPDVYDLYDENGLPVSRASVQQFSISMALRTPGEKWVHATWNQEFGGYMITEVLS
jgi:hypothetical protein